MLQQIRTAMGNTDMSKAFEAFVEIDETYVAESREKRMSNLMKAETKLLSRKTGQKEAGEQLSA
jgi:hypothetical protein